MYSGCSLHFEELPRLKGTQGEYEMNKIGQNSLTEILYIVGIYFTCSVAYQIIFILHTVDKYFGIRFKKVIATVIEA